MRNNLMTSSNRPNRNLKKFFKKKVSRYKYKVFRSIFLAYMPKQT